MQTFAPYSDVEKIASSLDYRRLGKQRVEAMQILNAIQKKNGWSNHPIVSMWRGYENALKFYCNTMISEWKRRGYNNTMKLYDIKGKIEFPKWWGREDFHSSHRAALLAKDFEYYSQFGWKEKPEIDYVWIR